MDEIGSMLQEARETSGVSITEASKDLKINELVLENIEGGKIGAFKDVYELKGYITNYAKYLGLEENKLIDEFNDYLFEYTSKIPVKELEKTIEQQAKQEEKSKVISPYSSSKKMGKWYYAIVLSIIVLLIILAVIWSIKQVTVGSTVSTTISYKR